MFARDAKRTETVQDGSFEAADFGEFGVDVEWIPVAVEAVERGLFVGCFFFDDDVWVAGRRLIGGRRGATISTLGRNPEATAAAHEERHFIVEEVLAGLGVFGGVAVDLDGGVAFVEDLDELRVVGDGGGGGDGEVADLEVLFAVQDHHG